MHRQIKNGIFMMCGAAFNKLSKIPQYLTNLRITKIIFRKKKKKLLNWTKLNINIKLFTLNTLCRYVCIIKTQNGIISNHWSNYLWWMNEKFHLVPHKTKNQNRLDRTQFIIGIRCKGSRTTKIRYSDLLSNYVPCWFANSKCLCGIVRKN